MDNAIFATLTQTLGLTPDCLKKIAMLHPKVRQAAIDAALDVAMALTGSAKFIIPFTLRTFAEQQAIYNQGRTTKGDVVTKAKPGQSFHNYGLALDFALQINNKALDWHIDKDWDGDHKSDWMEVVDCFKKHGWEWGGNWNSIKDYPHFQMSFGHTWQELLELHISKKVDQFGYVLI